MSKKYDVAIVLGGSLEPNGRLKIFVKKRVDQAVSLYKEKTADNLIMCGSSSFFIKKSSRISEAEAMCEYAVLEGVRRENIFLEERSRDTIGNVYYSGKIIKKNKWKRIIYISSHFHSKRLKYLLNKMMSDKYKIKLILTDDSGVNQRMLNREVKLLKIMQKIFCFIPRGWEFIFAVFLIIEYRTVPLFLGIFKNFYPFSRQNKKTV